MSKEEPSKESVSTQENFTNLFIAFYKSFESPNSFWRWSSYSIISSILRDKVYYEYGAGRLYPNIYVLLLADSAEYRKGAPIIAARKLLNLIKVTKLFSGTASIQAILDELSQDVADRTTGKPIKGGSALITADELAAFFVSDPRLIPLLTDMWEYREEYDYKLRGGSIKIKNLCVSLLAASNETFLREVYDSRAVYGGLLGRTYMVKPDETRPPNSFMYVDLDKFNVKPLTDSLLKIRELNGAVRKTEAAAKLYDEWYKELYGRYKKHPDRTGVLQRMHTNVLKLAIIIAASNYSLEITREVFEEAILQVTSLKQNYDIYVMSAGKSDMAQVGSKLIAAMQEDSKGEVKRKDFLMKNWADVDVETFDKLIETLRSGGMLDIIPSMTDIVYRMTERCRAMLEKKES